MVATQTYVCDCEKTRRVSVSFEEIFGPVVRGEESGSVLQRKASAYVAGIENGQPWDCGSCPYV